MGWHLLEVGRAVSPRAQETDRPFDFPSRRRTHSSEHSILGKSALFRKCQHDSGSESAKWMKNVKTTDRFLQWGYFNVIAKKESGSFYTWTLKTGNRAHSDPFFFKYNIELRNPTSTDEKSFPYALKTAFSNVGDMGVDVDFEIHLISWESRIFDNLGLRREFRRSMIYLVLRFALRANLYG